MACQRLALCLLFLLAGNEVLAARQRVKLSTNVRELNGLFANIKGGFQTNAGSGSTLVEDSLSGTTCNKDIIVESSDGSKSRVLAKTYVKEDVEVLKKHASVCMLTYSLVCSNGRAAIRKDSTCAKSEMRYFGGFHFWRATQIKSNMGETKITFSDAVGLPNITSGKVKFTPCSKSCNVVLAAMKNRTLEIESMLNHKSFKDFQKLALILKDYRNKKHEAIAMGCPTEMVNESKINLVGVMRTYFDKHQGGHDSPMADARFSAALDKIKSVQNPTKKDFAEAVALMRFGACPEAKETQISADSLTHLVENVDDESDDESAEKKLEEDLQTCFADENCDAINAKLPEMSSLMQQEYNNSVLVQTTGWKWTLANVLIFIAFLILAILFWPIALYIAICYLLVLAVMLPLKLLSGRTVVYKTEGYRLGAFDYLVDNYCRPIIDSDSGFPLRQIEGEIKPAEPAQPVLQYVIHKQKSVVDDRTGWPIAMLDNGEVVPIIGLPKPAV